MRHIKYVNRKETTCAWCKRRPWFGLRFRDGCLRHFFHENEIAQTAQGRRGWTRPER